MGEKSRSVLDAADTWLAAIETQEWLGKTESLQEELTAVHAQQDRAAEMVGISSGSPLEGARAGPNRAGE